MKSKAQGEDPWTMTIPEFCEHFRISRRKYEKLRKEGQGPPELRISRKAVRIDFEGAKKWKARLMLANGKAKPLPRRRKKEN